MTGAPTRGHRVHRDHGADPLRQHVAMLHLLAGPLAGSGGKLVLCRFGEDPETGRLRPPLVRHFEIGDADGMARAVRALAAARDRNLYVAVAVVRPDLPQGQKGSERDVMAVLALVGDFDDPDAAAYEARLPLPPDYVLETSPGRFQAFYILDKPATVAEAKPVAEALKALAGCDHGTADMSHVWRVPGTPNWPTKKKVDGGRPRKPQPVRVVTPWSGTRTSLAALREALARAGYADPSTAPEQPAHPTGRGNGADGGEDFTPLLTGLPDGLRRKIVGPTPEGERSEAIFFVVAALIERGHTDDRIGWLFRTHPHGIGAKRYYVASSPKPGFRVTP